MNKFTGVSAILTAILSVNLVYSGRIVPDVLKERVEDAVNGSYQIIDGNCTNAVNGDLVYNDHVHKTKIPLFKRSENVSWHGDETIYCLEALNVKDQATGGTARIVEGGVNHTFVTIEMDSFTGHGIEFNIFVYGKKR